MNQQFNLSRFGLMLKLYWAENGKSYLISLSLLIGGILLLMTPILATQRYNDLLYILHISAIFGVILGGSLFTSTAFNAYNNSSQGISAIILPASRLEKFLVILLTNLVFVVSVPVIAYLLHHGILEQANEHLLSDEKYEITPSFVIWVLGFTYFILHGFTFLGSLYFTKNAYIMTLGVLTFIVVLAYLFNSFLAYQFVENPRMINAFPFTGWDIMLDRRYRIGFPEPAGDLIKVFLGAVVIALWCITYVRLKEKEI